MVLSTDSIERLCKGNKPLIKPYDVTENRENPAKTELHLGAHCYCSGSQNNDIIELENDGDVVIIKPNTIFLFETKEVFDFPKNLSGHMSLKMGLISKGLFMPNQTQIDPGYNNVLFGMMYNLSSRDVELRRGQAITTLEVFQTERSQYDYSGNMQKITFEQFVKVRINSSLGVLEEDVRKAWKKLDASRKYWDRYSIFVTLVITVISIVMGITNIRTAFKDDATLSQLEYKVEELTEELEEYKSLVKQQNNIIEEYKGKVNTLKDFVYENSEKESSN